MVDDARVALGVSESTTVPHNVDEIIVQGTKQKRRILQEYKEAFGADYLDSIVTKKKGKHYYINPDWPIICMKPSSTKYYRVEELTIYNVITTVIKEFQDSFESADLISLSCTNKDFLTMILNMVHWLQIDFSSLRDPCYDYESKPRSVLIGLRWRRLPWYTSAWTQESLCVG